MGTLLTSAAVLNIDTCPMEGIDPRRYDELLGLGKKGFKTYGAVALGYRSENDKYANKPKVRFPKDKMIDTI